MDKFLIKNLSFISFIFIPIIFLWHPNWAGLLGAQPYWPLIWLLPFSMVYGSFNGVIYGLFLGLVLDSIIISQFTQIPGLIICGIWFGRVKIHSNSFVGHFRHGLICSIGSFFCGLSYLSQILIENPSLNLLPLYPGIKNILVQVFLTGLFAPLICSQLLVIFKISKEKNKFINL